MQAKRTGSYQNNLKKGGTKVIQSYKYDTHIQLVEHFNVSEFRCKCGGTHDIKINPELPEKLEQLFKKLNCSKIIINSGYRCPTHSTNVGGYSTDYHTKGYAADIVCYDLNGNKIDSKKVCCAAQDIGFGGIANVDSTYTITHVDVRTENFWKGDETISNSTICEDFYSYYGLPKTDIDDRHEIKLTIDVSLTINGKKYNGSLKEES